MSAVVLLGKIVATLGLFAALLVALGPRVGQVELTIGLFALAATLAIIVRRHPKDAGAEGRAATLTASALTPAAPIVSGHPSTTSDNETPRSTARFCRRQRASIWAE